MQSADRYTKFVLTVIATALTTIALRNAGTPEAPAFAQPAPTSSSGISHFNGVDVIPAGNAFGFILFDRYTGRFAAYDMRNAGNFSYEQFGTPGRIDHVGARVEPIK